MDEEVRAVRLEIMADPKIGVVAQSSLRREYSRLWRDRAARVREESRIKRYQARNLREKIELAKEASDPPA